MRKKTPDYDNVFKTMKSKHKRLFPYIPFYITRYEKEMISEGSMEEIIKDLEYFRKHMIRFIKRKNYPMMSL